MNVTIKRDVGVGRVLLSWWNELDEHRADRAVLRRAGRVLDVALSPPYQRLHRRLKSESDFPAQMHDERLSRWAAAIGLLAHVKTDDMRLVPECMSNREGELLVSELRFVRLLESHDIEGLFVGLRRVLPLTRNQINIVELANDVVNWGDAVRKKWAYHYAWEKKQS